MKIELVHKKDKGTMKKFRSLAPMSMIILLFFGPDSAISINRFQQELSHMVTVVNIEDPVRVFKGGKFVDNLSLGDFEVYEDGRPQKIEAVHLIRNTSIRKEEGPKRFSPDAKNRYFVLLFEMDDYLREIDKIFDYFIINVLAPEDTVLMVTLKNNYHLKKGELTRTPREKIAERFKARLRKDLQQEGSDLRILTEELKMLAEEASMMPAEMRSTMRRIVKIRLREIQEMKRMDESGLANFADILKKMEGQKKEIEVKVKSGNYQINHRAGYIDR